MYYLLSIYKTYPAVILKLRLKVSYDEKFGKFISFGYQNFPLDNILLNLSVQQ